MLMESIVRTTDLPVFFLSAPGREALIAKVRKENDEAKARNVARVTNCI